MTIRILFVFASSLLLSLAFSTTPAQAQDWRQEVQIIAPLGYGEPLQVLTDSVGALFTRKPELLVQRDPKELTHIPAGELSDQLYEEGVHFSSATHAFIRYRFTLGRGSEVTETITAIYFIYRGSDAQADVPILYLDAEGPIISDYIRTQGIPSLVNMEVGTTFREMLAFPYLTERQETAMVEIGHRSLRGSTVTHPQRVLEKFLDDHILSSGVYVLALPESQEAQVPPVDSTVVKVTALP